MTYEFEYLMHLFTCGARGMTPAPPRQAIDFDRLLQLAHEQSVLHMVGVALINSPDFGFPSDKMKSLFDNTRRMALANYMKRRLITNLLQDFAKAGIHAVLLKGYSIADLYAEPNCRISCDTDIYVDIKDEIRACKLLQEHGCEINPRSPISHHTVCHHIDMGNIELHIFLYDEIVEEIWFENMDGNQFVQESDINYDSSEGTIFTLGRTDNLIFLVLHMIKHFIFSGINLRQIMDIALYIEKYRSCLDWKRFYQIINTLHYRKLISTILGIIEKYFGFSIIENNLIDRDNVLINALLEDIETGAKMGSNGNAIRRTSWHWYNYAKYTNKRGRLSYWFYMLRRNSMAIIHDLVLEESKSEKHHPLMIIYFIACVKWCFLIISKLFRETLINSIFRRKKIVIEHSISREELLKLMQIL